MIETSSPLHILFVNDNENERLLFREAFQKSNISCEISECSDAEQVLEQLSSDSSLFDVVAVDNSLAGTSGMDLCKKLLDEKIPLPLVFLTETGSERLAAEALNAGVHDYIIKDPKGGYLELLPMSLTKIAIRYNDRPVDRQTDELMDKSEQTFKTIFDNAADGILLADVETKKFYMGNHVICQMLGYGSQKLTDLSVMDIHPEKDTLQVMEQFEKQARGELTLAKDIPVKKKDGKVFYADVNAFSITLDGKAYLMGIFRDVSERKRAEETKMEYQTLIRGIMDNAGSIVVVRNLQGQYLMVNREVEKLLGMESKHIIGKTPNDIHSKDKANKILSDDKRVIDSRSLLEIEDQLDTKGETRTFLGTKFPLLNAEGDVYAVCTIATDITKRRQDEEEVRKFKTIADKAGHGVAISDLGGMLIYVNDSFAQMHKYSIDELIGNNLSIFHTEEQMEHVDLLIDQIIQKGGFVAEEVWHKRKDNTIFPALMSATLVRDEFEKPLFMAATAIDITKNKEAEELLRYSEERYRSVVEDSPLLLCSFLPNGEIVFVNNAYCKYFDKTREELVGSNFKHLIPKGDRQAVMNNIMSLNIDCPIMTHEHRVYAPDGQMRWQRWTNRALFDEHGLAVSFQSFGEDITDHKKVEAALQESELRYHTLFEILPVGVGLSTSDGRIIDINSTFQQMLGYSIEQIRQIDVHETYYNPTERAPFLKQLQQDGSVRGFEVELKRKDGTIFLADLNVTTMKMRGESVIVTVARDITEQRRMERALAESEEKYRTLVECAGDPIFTVNNKGVFLFANKVAAKTVGYEPEGLEGKTLWDVFPKETADRQATNVQKVIETGRGINIISLTEVQNKSRWYSTTIEPLRDEQGKATAAMVIARDVDDMKRAEEQIQKLNSAVESSISGIAIGDAEGNLTYVNHALLEMWGYKDENEVLGRSAVEFWENEIEGSKFLAEVQNNGSWIGELKARRKNGSIFYVQVCGTLMKDKNDKPVSIMGSFVDITESKSREEELTGYRGQMARAEQLASLGTLSATIAHQLTQPLTVIRLSIDNALDELEASSSSQKVIKRLKDSVTQISNITSIIENFRNFARKSSGKTVAEVNIKAVVIRIARLLSQSALSAGISIRIRNMDDLPCPWMNENDLEQLFFALIENAIQAADGKKTRHLVISSAVKDQHIELRLSDDCGGIQPENIDKIFEPFFTTKPRGQGTGLGLCIVKDTVSRIGGQVRVESKLGKGTTFIIKIPIEKNKIS
jgi:two-component system cell cycle sensor histidine kinase/response regulator CckA